MKLALESILQKCFVHPEPLCWLRWAVAMAVAGWVSLEKGAKKPESEDPVS